MTFTVGSLFAGIGGFDLAARRVGWRTAWYSEIEPYACRVMQKHFPDAVNLGDIRHISHPPAVDVLCGGFPCQDISTAGKGAGITGARSGLWKEYARIIEEVRPQYVVIENVSALLTRGLDVVLYDLAALGYDAEWHAIPAAYVGAPHRRDRIWIMAYPNGQRYDARGSHSSKSSNGIPDLNGHRTFSTTGRSHSEHGPSSSSDAMAHSNGDVRRFETGFTFDSRSSHAVCSGQTESGRRCNAVADAYRKGFERRHVIVSQYADQWPVRPGCEPEPGSWEL